MSLDYPTHDVPPSDRPMEIVGLARCKISEKSVDARKHGAISAGLIVPKWDVYEDLRTSGRIRIRGSVYITDRYDPAPTFVHLHSDFARQIEPILIEHTGAFNLELNPTTGR